jgi:hypothetical protein
VKRALPRTIWMAWYQGLRDAPPIIRVCHDSWVRQNPGWDVILLDETTADRYVNVGALVGRGRTDIDPQKRSELLRMNLLARYGGVWVDATCFCGTPLDDWIFDAAREDFFVFRDPGVGRIISNWFLACTKDSYLTRSFNDVYNAYWATNVFSNQESVFGNAVLAALSPALARHSGFWAGPLARRVLRVYPYFIFHYLFAREVRRDVAFARAFARVPYVSAHPSHMVQKLSRLGAPVQSIHEMVLGLRPPVHKLTWKEPIFRRNHLDEEQYVTAVCGPREGLD